MTHELILRRNRATDPRWFDLIHRRWEAAMRAAANARFPVKRDAIGRFSQERNEA